MSPDNATKLIRELTNWDQKKTSPIPQPIAAGSDSVPVEMTVNHRVTRSPSQWRILVHNAACPGIWYLIGNKS